MKNEKKIALFGGSFNPFHKIHLLIVKRILSEKFVDEVWIIPCKKHAFNKELVGSNERTKMINLATEDLENVKIDSIEIDKSGKKPSYMSETIKELKEKYGYEFYLTIGGDNLKDLEKWKDFDYLKDNVKFILAQRDNYNSKNNKIKIYKEIDASANISSTIIRNRLKENLPIDDLVPTKVGSYIQERGLYK